MPATIETHELRRLLDAGGVQLVEVLPAPEFELEHLPGAVHLPLASMTRQAASQLDPARPVVAYCFDYQ